MVARARLLVLIAACAFGASGSARAQETGWYPLELRGGLSTLSMLGVAESRPRSAVMIDLIRRLHFSTESQPALRAALHRLRTEMPQAPSIVVPSPLPPDLWSNAVLGRAVSADQIAIEILNDPNAQLLFHGLAGMDAGTRAWMADRPGLLQRLYRHEPAVRAFALFAPAVVVREGRVAVPGGPAARDAWAEALRTSPDQTEQFVARLFEDREGRSAGLYFAIAHSSPGRQRFITGPPGSLRQLLPAFARCYSAHANAYPFVVRSHDAALLLLEVALTDEGQLPGPIDGELWSAVLERRGVKTLDAVSMTDVLCGSGADERRAVFETILAAQRVFAPHDRATAAHTSAALRGRRRYPALFISLEQAGARRPDVYAALVDHADRVAAIRHPGRALTATRLFQGAIALTVNANRAGSIDREDTDALLMALALTPLNRERYDGAIGRWLEKFLNTIRARHVLQATFTAEQVVAFALAGPVADQRTTVVWDGEAYVLDLRGTIEGRLHEVRAQQGGPTLDAVLERAGGRRMDSQASGPGIELIPADEYRGDALSSSQLRDPRSRTGDVVDYVLAHVLASWAYAPHVGDPSGAAMIAGDGSLRHQLGVRQEGRARHEQRWRVASPPSRGGVAGSLLALDAPLAGWSLRRLSATALPPRRQIGGNDLVSLTLTAALVDARRLHDEQLADIAAAVARGAVRIMQGMASPAALDELADAAALSPWRRAALPWMVEHEPERVPEQFSMTAVAGLGGLTGPAFDAWGTANIVTGCLCVAMAPARVPELFAGRAADGIVGAQSSDLMIRIAVLLSELKMPAGLAAAVLSYAMRDFLDHVQPQHPADVEAFERQARALDRRDVEDYLSAIATVGPLRPVTP